MFLRTSAGVSLWFIKSERCLWACVMRLITGSTSDLPNTFVRRFVNLALSLHSVRTAALKYRLLPCVDGSSSCQVGMRGNEIADELAWKGAERTIMGMEPFIGVTQGQFKAWIKKNVSQENYR